ncbi:MAG: radical SAM protein [Elusimicrobiota bacterium]
MSTRTDRLLYEEALAFFAGQPLSFDRVFPPLTAGAEREPWSFEEVLAHWDAWAQGARSGKGPALLNCYVHFPFCRAKCTYCMHYSREAEGRSEMERYLRAQKEHLRALSGVFKGIELRNLAVGGGTPSLAGPRAAAEWLETLFTSLKFSPEGERTFECNPDSLTPALLDVLKRCGINRLSLGVQTLDRAVLRRVNRGYQTPAQVLRAVRLAREKGFEHGVNVDLLLGLVADTPESFLESFRRITAESPDGVFINGLMPTPAYIQKHYAGDSAAAVAHSRRLQEALEDKLMALAAKAGYSLAHGRGGSWDLMFVRKGIAKFYFSETTFYLAEETRLPFSLLSVGCLSRSHVFGRCHYEQGPLPFDRFDPEARVYEGFRVGAGDELLKFALASLCQGRDIPRGEVERLFGRGLKQAFGAELKALSSKGLVEVRGGKVRFTAEGLRERYLTAFALAGPERVERMLRQRRPEASSAPVPSPGKRQCRLRGPASGGLLERKRREGFEQAVFVAQGAPAWLQAAVAKAKDLGFNVVLECDGSALAEPSAAAKLLPFLDGVCVDLRGKQALAALRIVQTHPKHLGVAVETSDPSSGILERVSRFGKVRHFILAGGKPLEALAVLDPIAAKAKIGLRVRGTPACALGDFWRYSSDLYEDLPADGRSRAQACSGCGLKERCPGVSPGQQARPLRV